MAQCATYYVNADSQLPLTDAVRARVQARMDEWASAGLRVLAFAHGPVRATRARGVWFWVGCFFSRCPSLRHRIAAGGGP